MHISVINISNKPCQCRSTDYWADDTFGILKHVNKKTYFIYFQKTPQALPVYSLNFHNKNCIVFL